VFQYSLAIDDGSALRSAIGADRYLEAVCRKGQERLVKTQPENLICRASEACVDLKIIEAARLSGIE
jgi:hypothetical protein